VKKFTAQRQGDEVLVVWEILEDHFDPEGFRLECQFGAEQPARIPAQAGQTGQTRFRVSGSGILQVRLIVKDKAGNQSVASADVTINQDNEEDATIHWHNAQAHLAAKEYSRAIGALNRFVSSEQDPNRLVEGWFALGNAYTASGEPDKARAAYYKCIEFPHASFAFQARYQLAVDEMNNKNYDQARNLLIQILEAKDATPDRATHEKSSYKIADLFVLLKDYDKAVIYYEMAIQQYPQSDGILAARGQLGECYLELAQQTLEKLKTASADKKAYYEMTRKHWLERGAAVCESLADELEHKARQSPLAQSELNLLRKALFGAAQLRFEMNEFAEALRRYEALQEKYRKRGEGLIAGLTIWRIVAVMNETPDDRQRARTAAANALEKVKADLETMPEESDAFRGERVWSKRQWDQWAQWVDEQLKKAASAPRVSIIP
jgi:tetratricopeptide (TPR) repeat protein